MSEPSSTVQPVLSTFYKGWSDYQTHLITAIAPLSPEQLALRAAPQLRTIGEIATHMIGARARWFHRVMGVGDEQFASMAMWDRKEQPVRSAADLVNGLEDTWQVMQDSIARWTSADMVYVYEGTFRDEAYRFTRSWVIWHLIEHDVHHGGEISLSLGMHSLTAPDI